MCGVPPAHRAVSQMDARGDEEVSQEDLMRITYGDDFVDIQAVLINGTFELAIDTRSNSKYQIVLMKSLFKNGYFCRLLKTHANFMSTCKYLVICTCLRFKKRRQALRIMVAFFSGLQREGISLQHSLCLERLKRATTRFARVLDRNRRA